MRVSTAESALAVAATATPAQPSQLEREVIDMFGRLRVPLLRYAFGFGLPVHDAEEIVQEVFLALFQHLQRGKSRENLTGWVFRVTHNLALKRRASLNSTSAAGAEECEVFADPAPSPEDQSASNQAQRLLLAVFRALPEQDRRCLTLRAEGLRYREIGQILGVSLGAVSHSLSRSLARLTRAVRW